MAPVVIVDYGMCNLDSIARAVEECGARPTITDDPVVVESADKIILPGVGAFADAMRNIRARGLDHAMDRRVRSAGAPLLGICLGMQLLAGRGLEGGPVDGFGWIDSEVRRLDSPGNGERIPHVGWNEVQHDGTSPLMTGIEPGKDFYFAHSYHMACADVADVVATTPYCGGFASVVRRANIYGTQFHPEKSQKAGFRLLANFVAI